MRQNTRGPFGNALRFELVDLTEAERAELKSLGTYGVIKGASLFIAGAVTRGARAMEDFGFGMERNILFATTLGLGTCWLGGTLNRAGFARKIGLAPEELMPAISPVGYSAEKRSLTDRAFRFMAKSDKRKPWEDLFFDDRPGNPLVKENAGACGQALESVRIGPSASNRQPWRIIREGASCHFFLAAHAGLRQDVRRDPPAGSGHGDRPVPLRTRGHGTGDCGKLAAGETRIRRRDVGVRRELGH